MRILELTEQRQVMSNTPVYAQKPPLKSSMTKEQRQAAFDEIQNDPKYKELMKYVKLVSTNGQRTNGTLEFSLIDDHMSDTFKGSTRFMINSSGFVTRYTNQFSPLEKHPEVVLNYGDALGNLKKQIAKLLDWMEQQENFLKQRGATGEIKTKDDVLEWLSRFGIKHGARRTEGYDRNTGKSLYSKIQVSVHDDLSVDVNLDVKLEKVHVDKLPIKFNKCRVFRTINVGLKTTVNCPINVERLILSDNDFSAPSSLEGLKGLRANYLNLYNCNIESLHDIHKIVKNVKLINVSNNPLKSHILGLLLIDGVESITISSNNQSGDLVKVHNIFHAWMQEKSISRNDLLLRVQEDLLEAGFDEYAQI